MLDVASEIVAEIEPAEGWLVEDTEERLIASAMKLLLVMSTDDALEVLEDITKTLREEFE